MRDLTRSQHPQASSSVRPFAMPRLSAWPILSFLVRKYLKEWGFGAASQLITATISNAAFGQRAGFARIVREQTNPFDAEIAHDRGREVEVPAIGLEPEGVIGLDRIEPGILQLVGLQLCHQADAAALLILIDHKPATFLGDGPHGHLQLVVAITAQRSEHFSREALRMESQQRNSVGDIAHDDRERGLNPPSAVRDFALESDGFEHPPSCRHAGGRDAP